MSDTATANTQDPEPSVKPAAREQYGTISAAYFPREVTLAAGGQFTAHEISIRRSFKAKDGPWDHRSLTIDRKEAMNLLQALTDVYRASYRVAPKKQAEAAE